MKLKAYEQVPLRVLITNKCNGNCYFCHKEGNTGLNKSDMTVYMFEQVINAAREQGIRKIVMSGGEPTLSDNIQYMVCAVKSIYPGVELSVTTNGANILQLLEVRTSFDKLNLSISSLYKRIYMKYQGIDPVLVLNTVQNQGVDVTVNIVVTRDNYNELEDIVSFCIGRNISVEILFELCSYNEIELAEQIKIIYKFEDKYGDFSWVLKNVPSLRREINKKICINIKHPYFNQYFEWDYCFKCNKKKVCFERICSVRVDVDGNVFPCLNHHVNLNKDSIKKNIQLCYSQIDNAKLVRKWENNHTIESVFDESVGDIMCI